VDVEAAPNSPLYDNTMGSGGFEMDASEQQDDATTAHAQPADAATSVAAFAAVSLTSSGAAVVAPAFAAPPLAQDEAVAMSDQAAPAATNRGTKRPASVLETPQAAAGSAASAAAASEPPSQRVKLEYRLVSIGVAKFQEPKRPTFAQVEQLHSSSDARAARDTSPLVQPMRHRVEGEQHRAAVAQSEQHSTPSSPTQQMDAGTRTSGVAAPSSNTPAAASSSTSIPTAAAASNGTLLAQRTSVAKQPSRVLIRPIRSSGVASPVAVAAPSAAPAPTSNMASHSGPTAVDVGSTSAIKATAAAAAAATPTEIASRQPNAHSLPLPPPAISVPSMAAAASSGPAAAPPVPALALSPHPDLPAEEDGDVDSDEEMEDFPHAHVDETASIAATQPTAALNSNEEQPSIACAPQTAVDAATAGSASFTSASVPVATAPSFAPLSQSTALSSSSDVAESSASVQRMRSSNEPFVCGTSVAASSAVSPAAASFWAQLGEQFRQGFSSAHEQMGVEWQAKDAAHKAALAVKDAQLAAKDVMLAEQAAEIAALKGRLANCAGKQS
jgi:hypothetical protein